MKLVKNILLNNDGKMGLHAPNASMTKRGILQVENFSIAKNVAFKPV